MCLRVCTVDGCFQVKYHLSAITAFAAQSASFFLYLCQNLRKSFHMCEITNILKYRTNDRILSVLVLMFSKEVQPCILQNGERWRNKDTF